MAGTKKRFLISTSTKSGDAPEFLTTCDPSQLAKVIHTIVKGGCAVTFGATKAQDALFVSILEKGEIEKVFVDNESDFQTLLDAIEAQSSE